MCYVHSSTLVLGALSLWPCNDKHYCENVSFWIGLFNACFGVFFFFVSPQRISFLFGNPLLISYQVVRVYFIYFVHVTFCRHFAGRSESYRAQTNNNNGIMLLIFIKMPIFCIPSFVGLLPWPGGIRMYGIYQSGVFSGYFTILLVQIQYSVCVPVPFADSRTVPITLHTISTEPYFYIFLLLLHWCVLLCTDNFALKIVLW